MNCPTYMIKKFETDGSEEEKKIFSTKRKFSHEELTERNSTRDRVKDFPDGKIDESVSARKKSNLELKSNILHQRQNGECNEDMTLSKKLITNVGNPFEIAEDELIMKNWEEFCKIYGWDSLLTSRAFDSPPSISNERDKFLHIIIKNLVELIPNILDQLERPGPLEKKFGSYADYEDIFILEIMRKCPEVGLKNVAKILNRSEPSIVRRKQTLNRKAKRNFGKEKLTGQIEEINSNCPYCFHERSMKGRQLIHKNLAALFFSQSTNQTVTGFPGSCSEVRDRIRRQFASSTLLAEYTEATVPLS